MPLPKVALRIYMTAVELIDDYAKLEDAVAWHVTRF